VHSVAAAVALPSREGDSPSVQRMHATVGGALTLAPEPTVVTARAHHRADLTAVLAEGATLHATEQVLLGRAGEEPGRRTGTTRVTWGGRPLLRTTVALGPGAPGWLPPVAPRAYAATVSVGTRLPVATGPDAVRLPLDDGWAATAWGTELHRVVRALEALGGRGEEVA
jgi:urease accessory protein